jgi:hypothetical protein
MLACRVQGIRPALPGHVPLKGEYSKRDIDRSARFLGVPYAFPPRFPGPTLAAARGYYWLHGQDCGKAREFAHAVFRAYWVDGRDIGELPVVLEIADQLGIDRDAFTAAIATPEIKDRLKPGNRRGDRPGHVRRTLFHGGRRALLGRRPPAANRQVARHGRLLVSVIKSKLNTRSEEYKANAAAMSALVADLREKTIAVSGGGSPETAAKHKARGKLLPRERINALIDPGAPFLEFSPLAATACTAAMSPRPASSPASAGCRASSA